MVASRQMPWSHPSFGRNSAPWGSPFTSSLPAQLGRPREEGFLAHPLRRLALAPTHLLNHHVKRLVAIGSELDCAARPLNWPQVSSGEDTRVVNHIVGVGSKPAPATPSCHLKGRSIACSCSDALSRSHRKTERSRRTARAPRRSEAATGPSQNGEERADDKTEIGEAVPRPRSAIPATVQMLPRMPRVGSSGE